MTRANMRAGSKDIDEDDIMLESLDQLPRKAKQMRALLMQSTGSITHELGHIIAAAFAAGVPTDYLLVGERPHAQFHAAYINERYRRVLGRDGTAQVRIAAGGFVAEELIFGDAPLKRSRSDLQCIASLLGIPFDEKLLPFIARQAQSKCFPIISASDVGLVKALYRAVVAAIASDRYKIDGAHVIPFYVFAHPNLPIPLRRRAAATIRTRARINQNKALAALREGVPSGL